MINWNDPDYLSAGTLHHPRFLAKAHDRPGHFYALYQSVSVECNDPTSPGPGITSYVYGPNSTLDTPSIAFSNASTLINSARSFSDGSGMHGVLVSGVLVTTLLAHLF